VAICFLQNINTAPKDLQKYSPSDFPWKFGLKILF
jgi:hypothetical protein